MILSKKIIFLADFFIEDTLGGAELHDNVVLNHFKSLNLLDSKIRCQQLNKDFILANRDKVWFVGNFAGLSLENKSLILYPREDTEDSSRNQSK